MMDLTLIFSRVEMSEFKYTLYVNQVEKIITKIKLFKFHYLITMNQNNAK